MYVENHSLEIHLEDFLSNFGLNLTYCTTVETRIVDVEA